MIVRRARQLGMCSGVRRALQIVERTLADNPSVPVFTLGELVHNTAVVDEYRARGVVPIEDPRTVTGGLIVIRTHGVDPETRAACERPGVRRIDATCPKVRRIHELVRQRGAAGWSVIVAGDPRHDEVRGIVGQVPGCRVVSTPAEAETVPCGVMTIVVSQTTLARSVYEELARVIRSRCPDAEIANTTCPSTEERRAALVELAAGVDALLVIGSSNSANTRWLHAAAVGTGLPSWLIEGVAGIPPEIRAFERVGISAGASTPDRIIDDVERALTGAGNGRSSSPRPGNHVAE